MALQAKYQRYLANPTADALAANAAINYIPTLSTINGSATILKHLRVQGEQLTKKSETFLNVVESANSLCVETETTLEFLYGGGTYLPGMDDNFLADKVVTMMIVHIVTFDSEQKIQQIRLLWDQGSLLKSIDVIGRSGRNWPLHEGKDQARLVASSTSATPSTAVPIPESKPSRRRSRAGSKGEPHVPLNLFSPRSFEREDPPLNPVSTRESAKPPPRDYGDLFASGETAAEQSTSPTKYRENHLKGGAGTNFTTNRLFDEKPEQSVKAVGTSIKTNPDKFNHFEMNDAPITKARGPTKANLNASQWDFADFSTPIKKPTIKRGQDARHFGWGDDEGDTADPPADNHIAKARPDAKSQFAFDDAKKQQAFEPELAGTGRTGLYEDHITDPTNNPTDKNAAGKVLGNITNANQHRKTFESNWDMQDSIGDRNGVHSNSENDGINAKDVAQAKQRAGRIMVASAPWEHEESPKQQRGIKIAGNGMGSRKEGVGWWDF